MNRYMRTKACRALYIELEERFGPKLAADVIDQVKNVQNPAYTPDYMDVKALSEVLEVLRADLLEIVKALRLARKTEADCSIYDLDVGRLELRLKTLFPAYWITMHAFYRQYDRAMAMLAPSLPASGYERKRDVELAQVA